MVKNKWVFISIDDFEQLTPMQRLSKKLFILKGEVISWEKDKKKENERILTQTEVELQFLNGKVDANFFLEERKGKLQSLEVKKQQFLKKKRKL